jgi:hypothetical protein
MRPRVNGCFVLALCKFAERISRKLTPLGVGLLFVMRNDATAGETVHGRERRPVTSPEVRSDRTP